MPRGGGNVPVLAFLLVVPLLPPCTGLCPASGQDGNPAPSAPPSSGVADAAADPLKFSAPTPSSSPSKKSPQHDNATDENDYGALLATSFLTKMSGNSEASTSTEPRQHGLDALTAPPPSPRSREDQGEGLVLTGADPEGIFTTPISAPPSSHRNATNAPVPPTEKKKTGGHMLVISISITLSVVVTLSVTLTVTIKVKSRRRRAAAAEFLV